jgi:hypothetical protein
VIVGRGFIVRRLEFASAGVVGCYFLDGHGGCCLSLSRSAPRPLLQAVVRSGSIDCNGTPRRLPSDAVPRLEGAEISQSSLQFVRLSWPNLPLPLFIRSYLPILQLLQSQIDGSWRFAAPLSFSLASCSNGSPTLGVPQQKEIGYAYRHS